MPETGLAFLLPVVYAGDGTRALRRPTPETGLAFLLPVVRRQAGLASDAVRLPTAKLRVPTKSYQTQTGQAFTCPVVFAGDGTRALRRPPSSNRNAPAFLLVSSPDVYNKKTAPDNTEAVFLPETGLEPERPCGHKILSLARLPFRHSGLSNDLIKVA